MFSQNDFSQIWHLFPQFKQKLFLLHKEQFWLIHLKQLLMNSLNGKKTKVKCHSAENKRKDRKQNESSNYHIKGGYLQKARSHRIFT